MRDRGVIFFGLAIFLALLTFPAWHNLSAHVTGKGPNIRLPAPGKQCVAATDFMRSSHMKLLIDWRENVVREGARDFAAADGKHFDKSLTPTCLDQCHGGKAEFCDRCHEYAAVSPSCWNCHQDAQPAFRSAR